MKQTKEAALLTSDEIVSYNRAFELSNRMFYFKFHFCLFVFVFVGERATEWDQNASRPSRSPLLLRQVDQRKLGSSKSKYRSVNTDGWIWYNLIVSRKWLDSKTFVWLFGETGQALFERLSVTNHEFWFFKFTKSVRWKLKVDYAEVFFTNFARIWTKFYRLTRSADVSVCWIFCFFKSPTGVLLLIRLNIYWVHVICWRNYTKNSILKSTYERLERTLVCRVSCSIQMGEDSCKAKCYTMEKPH